MAEPKFKLPFQLPQFNQPGEQEGESKRRLYLLIGLLVVLVIGGFGLNYALNRPIETADLPNIPPVDENQLNEELVQILPLLERGDGEESQEGEEFKGISDPFSAPIQLQGIIIGEPSLAILKAQQMSYVISVGEKIGDIWELTEINKDSVILKSEEKEVTIDLAARK